MILSNLTVKSPITKIVDDNIFEGITYRFYLYFIIIRLIK